MIFSPLIIRTVNNKCLKNQSDQSDQSDLAWKSYSRKPNNHKISQNNEKTRKNYRKQLTNTNKNVIL